MTSSVNSPVTSPVTGAVRLPGERAAEYVDDPLHVDTRGMTATTAQDDWIHDLVHAVLFTRPGERVHRPDFGSGLQQLVFEPVSGELGSTVQFLVQGALQRWVGHLIEVNDVDVTVDEGQMRLTVVYTVRRTGRQVVDEVEVGAP